jgi:hypothetical protein
MQFDRRNGAGDSIRTETMKTLNPPKRQIPAPVVKPAQPKTSAERFAQQRRIHLKRKAKKKTQGQGISPKLSVPKQTTKAPVVNASTIAVPPAAAFSPETLKRFNLATKAFKGTRRLSEKLTIAACHLRDDPMLSTIDPAELWREVSSQNQ